MMTHEEVSELLAVFALDAVASHEHDEIEEHLSGCPRCRAELDAHREVAAALGNSVETLPEGLWSSISSRLPARYDEDPPPMPRLAGVSGEGTIEAGRPAPSALSGPSAPFAPPGPSRLSRPRRLGTVVVGSIAAVAAVIAAVLAVSLVHDNHRITNLQQAVGSSAHSAAVAALRTPGHKVVNLESPGPGHRLLAEFVVVPDGRGYLVKSNLPVLAARDTYQLWGQFGGRSISLGLLGRSPNQATFTSAGSRSPSVLAITVEPAGGSVTPTLPTVATGEV
jgi:anti-sigma factor RsiW